MSAVAVAAPCQNAVAASPLAGLSNHGQNKHEPNVTAGDRTYLIGTQDGNFPDQGGHVRGQMGGLWLHPIKLIDGFVPRLTDLVSRRDTVLAEDRASYADFYGTRAQAVNAAHGAIKQIKLGEDTLTPRDTQLISYYEQLGRRFAAMPDTSRAWITNENWVIAPMEMGIAPRARAIRLLDRIRRQNVGAYGPYLSAVERQAMMTISTGVEAEAEARYGRSDDALWYMEKIAETFGLRSPGTISEMMPDYGNFVIAWTSYGIVVPLVEHFFGIVPDAPAHTVALDPHPPTA
ncbi:MAG TPA: hypothetical protein VF102_00010 [Gemmatimonadaceae bacterium]